MIKATGLKTNYQTQITNGKHTVFADADVTAGGSGDYARPGDLLASSLAGCMNITTRQVLDREGYTYDSVEVYVDLDRSNPDLITFKTKTVILSKTMTEEEKKAIIKRVENCPVCNILRAEKKFETFE